MRPKSPREREDDRRLKERAADWLGELPSANAAERAEFAKWVRQSPQHLEEFLFAAVAAEAIRRVDVEKNAALREKLADVTGQVVPLPRADEQFVGAKSGSGGAGFTPEQRGRRLWMSMSVAAGVVALLATGDLALHHGGNRYSTTVGEQRTIELVDRSVVHLNGLSRIQVHYSGKGREIQLLSGEALFEVAADATRPFRVVSGATIIRALGTEFGVLRRSSGTTVSVVEGLVQVANERLTAGDEVRVAVDGRVEKRASVDVAAISSWRQHRLIFRDETLTDVAAEFNRYNHSPRIAVEGNVENARKLSGVFDANDPRSLLRSLSDDPDLEVVESRGRLLIRVR